MTFPAGLPFQLPEDRQCFIPVAPANSFFRLEIPTHLWAPLIDPAAEIILQVNTPDTCRLALRHAWDG